ncbi:hypothetical protein Fmac_024543 [Flemingia macrophylla]|uniref:Myb/SANT-like domain-containing protein n=1 Tax=Flemingia macrophylla TaxID=520843 RepID=A0ABD1LPP3_9FABA
MTNIVLACCILHNFFRGVENDDSLLADVDRELMEEDMDTMSTQVREEDYREGSNIRDFTKWTDDMDFRLLIAMLEEARLGNRVDGNGTAQAYNNIVESLKQSGLISITKYNVKNRQKSLKDRWREVHDLFSGLSGFTRDESTKRFTAEPEVWDDLIKAKPYAAKWKVNPIRYYDLMEELWGVDRATGHMARTTHQTRKNISTQSLRVDLNDDVDYIPEE